MQQLKTNFQIRLQILAKLTILSIVTVLALVICFYVGERFFFDRLFYKKSSLHGYFNRYIADQSKSKKNWLDNILISFREKDLNLLLSGKLPRTKDPDTKTIVVIGDSYTYGVGVLPHERFSSLLAPILLKEYGIKAKVYNFSEPGNSIIDYYVLYQLTLAQMQPDLVIFEIVTNDLMLNTPRYPRTQEITQELDKACTMPLFVNTTNATTSAADYANAEIESFLPKWRNLCYLRQIAAAVSKDERVMFFGFSNGAVNFNCEWENAYSAGLVITEYASILKHAGNAVFLNRSVDNSNATVSASEGHPSRKKHRIYAEEQAQLIAKRFAEEK